MFSKAITLIKNKKKRKKIILKNQYKLNEYLKWHQYIYLQSIEPKISHVYSKADILLFKIKLDDNLLLFFYYFF